SAMRFRARAAPGSQPERRRHRVLPAVLRDRGVTPIVPAVDGPHAAGVQGVLTGTLLDPLSCTVPSFRRGGPPVPGRGLAPGTLSDRRTDRVRWDGRGVSCPRRPPRA